MDSDKLRLLLAEDHVLVRQGLKLLLDGEPDMEVVGEAGDGPEAVRLCELLQPDLALVDVSMPVWDGVKTIEMLRTASARMKIISVTRHDDPSFVTQMLAAGATGYVLKQSPSTQLTNAIRAVASGGQYVDSAIRLRPTLTQSRVRTTAIGDTPSMGEPLSDVKERVLRLIAMSRTAKHIGDEIGLRIDTVSDLKTSAMAKLGLYTRIQVIGYARSRGWLEYVSSETDPR